MLVGPKVHFKKAKLPTKKKLIGKYCFLEPTNVQKHSKDLFKNFSKNMLLALLFDCPFK